MPFFESQSLGDEFVIWRVKIVPEAAKHAGNAKIVLMVAIKRSSIKYHCKSNLIEGILGGDNAPYTRFFVVDGSCVARPKVSMKQRRLYFNALEEPWNFGLQFRPQFVDLAVSMVFPQKFHLLLKFLSVKFLKTTHGFTPKKRGLVRHILANSKPSYLTEEWNRSKLECWTQTGTRPRFDASEAEPILDRVWHLLPWNRSVLLGIPWPALSHVWNRIKHGSVGELWPCSSHGWLSDFRILRQTFVLPSKVAKQNNSMLTVKPVWNVRGQFAALLAFKATKFLRMQ